MADSSALLPVPSPSLHRIEALVLDAAPSPNSKRAYHKAIADFLTWYQTHGFDGLSKGRRPAVSGGTGEPRSGTLFGERAADGGTQTGGGSGGQTAYWRQNWRRGSLASKVRGAQASAPAGGLHSRRRKCFCVSLRRRPARE